MNIGNDTRLSSLFVLAIAAAIMLGTDKPLLIVIVLTAFIVYITHKVIN